MSLPYMPLYVADYLSATSHLDAAQSGAYLHLIMHYWQKGSLPTEDKFLARIAKMTTRQWDASKPIIKAFFTDDWKHDRIEKELLHALKKSEARSASGVTGNFVKSLKRKEAGIANANANASQTARKPLASSSGLDSEIEANASINKSSLRSDSSILSEQFRRFYAAYPKRVDPKFAEKKFMSVVKSGVDPERIIDAAARFCEAHRRARTDKQFIKAPAAWLNAGGYDSEDLPAPIQNGNQNGKRTVHDAARDLEASILAQTQFDLGLGPRGGDVVVFPGNGGEARAPAARLLPQGGGGGSGRVYGSAGHRAPEIS